MGSAPNNAWDDPALKKVAEDMNAELASKSSMEVGKIINNREGTYKVKVLSGYFLDPVYNRVSNHWTWIRVDDNGNPVGEEENGYGW